MSRCTLHAHARRVLDRLMGARYGGGWPATSQVVLLNVFARLKIKHVCVYDRRSMIDGRRSTMIDARGPTDDDDRESEIGDES